MFITHASGFSLLAILLFFRKFFVLYYQCTHCEHKHSRLRAFLERLNNWFNIIKVKASLKSLSKASVILLSAACWCLSPAHGHVLTLSTVITACFASHLFAEVNDCCLLVALVRNRQITIYLVLLQSVSHLFHGKSLL